MMILLFFGTADIAFNQSYKEMEIKGRLSLELEVIHEKNFINVYKSTYIRIASLLL